VGARDKATLTSLLVAGKSTQKPVFFKCRREYSEAIVNHFVKEKNLVKNRYHQASQANVFVIS
jgi:hypothetical protein